MLQNMKNRASCARMRAHLGLTILFTFALVFESGSASAADFEAGLRALRAGDIEQALEEWQPLAQAGHPDAQQALGMMYEYGHGFERDDEQAARWYEKAAEQNNVEAQYRLGVLLENGWGVTRDASMAVKWYARAAQLGHPFAQHDLAFMHFNGTGVRKDKVQAYKWLRIASEQRADLMAKHLSHVSRTMTSDEISEAEKLASAWLNSKDI